MKKLLLIAVATFVSVFCANAQMRVESPHPDLDINVTRCACASGTVVIDMMITNFGPEEMITFRGSYFGAVGYDDDGNQYLKDNSKISVGLLSVAIYDGDAVITLPQDIPMKFRIEVQDVNPNATKLALLKIPVRSKGAMALSTDKPILFRNVEWFK